ncbi:hypothetical protein [Paenibacillus solani]|nr:hypothetical protein [Paenibacillus solani]
MDIMLQGRMGELQTPEWPKKLRRQARESQRDSQHVRQCNQAKLTV